ncbi:MAG: hypothetical protein DWQ34_26645 [Planctomycetota bacterium]|nr:MAG: hypothetical protein DWQ34_26645 [Planctomycetota bacterium]REK22799.1 MAG: hypothetical protein DWQ41_18550 [Planctomycetota bacterium]REK33781.1 MAG: hypothetical protein DWQ45_14445 [Planctomycetota bacterium]
MVTHLQRHGWLLATVVWTGIAFLVCGALGRAAAAAVSVALSTALAGSLAVCGLAASVSAWWIHRPERRSSENHRSDYATGLAAVLGPMLLGLILVGESPLAVACVLLLSFGATGGIACATVSPGPFREAIGLTEWVGQSDRESSVLNEGQDASEPGIDGGESAVGLDEGFVLDAGVVQQMTRRTHDGTDELECVFRVEFAAGQRETSVHIPIWPAFYEIPNVECEPLDESDVSTTAAAVHTYGVRIDIRLPQASGERQTVLVGVQMAGCVKERVVDAA